jgi:hypothetical protein
MAAWMLFYAAALQQRMRIEWMAEALVLADDSAPAGAGGRARG